MNPLISGVTLAAISALAFIAYKHPREYRTIETMLSIILGSIFLGLTIWNSSATILFTKLSLPLEQRDAAQKILAAHQVFDGYLFISWIAVFTYLSLLKFLPRLGIIEKKKVDGPE